MHHPAPDITVVIPVLDEEANIAGCLAAVAAQDIDPSRVEVLVVDGGSRDRTRSVVRDALRRTSWYRSALIDNAEKTRPANLNRGLAEARGAVLCRVDARSRLPRDYLQRCLDTLRTREDIAVCGGRQVAIAEGGRTATAIARAFNNRALNGFSRYRGGRASGPADTVYLGAFRTEQLRAARGWRRDLPVNEDFDLNRRMSHVGVVWVDAGMVVGYVPRASFAALLRQYHAFGQSKVRYWRRTGDRPRPRQLAMSSVPVAVPLLALAAHAVGVSVPVLTAAGAAALVAVEVAGSRSPRAGLVAHIFGVAAMLCIGGGWIGGVVAETVAPRGEAAAAITADEAAVS
jgi:glycosyltransferase involved in cell wall biosynthesis